MIIMYEVLHFWQEYYQQSFLKFSLCSEVLEDLDLEMMVELFN